MTEMEADEHYMVVPVHLIEQGMTGDWRGLMAFVRDEGRMAKASNVAEKVSKAAEREAVYQLLFDAHKARFWSGKGREPQLRDVHRRLFRRALDGEGYTVDDILAIFDEVLRDDWYMGRDPKAPRKYTHIADIFRWDGRLDRFLTRSTERNEKSNDRNVQEKRNEVRLKLIEVGAKMRSGTAGFREKEWLLKSAKVYRDEWGEAFDWKTGEFTTG